MTPGYRLTPRAVEDLREIARYTLKTWGRNQRDLYLADIDRRFFWLAEHPRLGKHRSDVTEGYYSYLQGAHVIFYLIRADGIDIIGVPHQRMDVLGYFSG
jgi:toxin ParE1/3/4